MTNHLSGVLLSHPKGALQRPLAGISGISGSAAVVSHSLARRLLALSDTCTVHARRPRRLGSRQYLYKNYLSICQVLLLRFSRLLVAPPSLTPRRPAGPSRRVGYTIIVAHHSARVTPR